MLTWPIEFDGLDITLFFREHSLDRGVERYWRLEDVCRLIDLALEELLDMPATLWNGSRVSIYSRELRRSIVVELSLVDFDFAITVITVLPNRCAYNRELQPEIVVE